MNSDTGKPVILNDSRLTAGEFEKVKIAETIETRGEKPCRPLHSPLWQADSNKIRRMAPIEFIGRYMPEWFDYAICDEIHQLAGDTALLDKCFTKLVFRLQQLRLWLCIVKANNRKRIQSLLT